MKSYLQEVYNHSAYHMLPSIVRRVIHLYDDVFVEQGIELKLNIDQGIPVFKIKERDLAIVLTNLIENTIEAVQELPWSEQWISLNFQNRERWAYQMKTYAHKLTEYRIYQSMSRKVYKIS